MNRNELVNNFSKKKEIKLRDRTESSSILINEDMKNTMVVNYKN